MALTVDPELAVPPLHYGGIERIVDMLATGLVGRGHDVTVFAHPASATAGRLIAWPGRISHSRIDIFRNSATLVRHVIDGEFDLVHSFSRVAYLLPILPFPIPKLMTYQRKITRRSVKLGHTIARGTLWFSSVSRYLMEQVADVGTWRLVFNGVSLATYEFREKIGPEAPLVFLGRIEEIKGPHIAIEVARRTGYPLVIAGNVPPEHRTFFETKVKPYVDGLQVVYVGSVDDATKNELLGRARALLMPILWDEPFGIVMAEAMACGTPVIGFRRGAIPEVIEHGVTGHVVNDLDGLITATKRISQIARSACRARVERLFSDQVIVKAYENIYREMIALRADRRS